MKSKILIAVLSVSILCTFVVPVMAKGGFDEFGYNYQARIFVGTGESWSLAKGLPADYLGIYANDKLVMKWNDEWDRGNAEGWSDDYYGAWCTNHWNGKVQGGSGEVEQVKIIWVGTELEESEYWREGGYAIWGQFEVIMDHYVAFENAEEFVKAVPNGLIP